MGGVIWRLRLFLQETPELRVVHCVVPSHVFGRGEDDATRNEEQLTPQRKCSGLKRTYIKSTRNACLHFDHEPASLY